MPCSICCTFLITNSLFTPYPCCRPKGGQFTPTSYSSHDAGKKGPGKNILKSVSCTNNKCATIVYYSPVSEYHPISYASADNGQNWTPSLTHPSYEGTGYNELMSVVCTANICNAVGSYAPGGNGTPLHPINYTSTDNGKTWSLSTTIPPYQNIGFSSLFGITSTD